MERRSIHASKQQQLLTIERNRTDSTRSSAGVSSPSPPIPSFTSSSEASSCPSSLDSLSISLPAGGPPRRRRRKIGDLGAAEIWECPLYLCHKCYKKTSIQSIALHKAKCSSRPQLHLMSQQKEQLHKDLLLQQQSRQLYDQRLMLDRQQEERQKQLIALESVRQALCIMEQQQTQQQMIQRLSSSAELALNQPRIGHLPGAAAPFEFKLSSSQQRVAVGSTPTHLQMLQQCHLPQSLSCPRHSVPADAGGGPSPSVSLVTWPAVASLLESPPLVPLTVSLVDGSQSIQRPIGKDLHRCVCTCPFVSSATITPATTSAPAAEQSTLACRFSIGNAGPPVPIPPVNPNTVTTVGDQPLLVLSSGPLMHMPMPMLIPMPLPLPLAVHFATQQLQKPPRQPAQQSPLSSMNSHVPLLRPLAPHPMV